MSALIPYSSDLLTQHTSRFLWNIVLFLPPLTSLEANKLPLLVRTPLLSLRSYSFLPFRGTRGLSRWISTSFSLPLISCIALIVQISFPLKWKSQAQIGWPFSKHLHNSFHKSDPELLTNSYLDSTSHTHYDPYLSPNKGWKTPHLIFHPSKLQPLREPLILQKNNLI